jgi:hypothetical protein
MDGNGEEHLIEKLRKIEALYAGATTPGERVAAENALGRILQRLLELERMEPALEYRFTFQDGWSKMLFISLLHRYGLRPYRYRRQRRTTVMVKVTTSFVNEVLWPEFQELNGTLREHLDAVTQRIIRQAIHNGPAEVEERAEEGAGRTATQGFLFGE